MRIIKFTFVLISVLILAELKSQDTISNPLPIDKVSVGLGGGLDYGGFGVNLLYCPVKNVGIFAGAGYAFAGPGINGGVKLRMVPKELSVKISPFALIMYGYNAAIAVSNASQYNKLFYGPSIGLGTDIRGMNGRKAYWSVALLLPLRSSEVDQYIDDLKTNHGVEFKNELFPVGFSFGYRFVLSR